MYVCSNATHQPAISSYPHGASCRDNTMVQWLLFETIVQHGGLVLNTVFCDHFHQQTKVNKQNQTSIMWSIASTSTNTLSTVMCRAVDARCTCSKSVYCCMLGEGYVERCQQYQSLDCQYSGVDLCALDGATTKPSNPSSSSEAE